MSIIKKNRFLSKLAAGLALAGAAGLAQAQGIGLHYGYNSDYQRLTLQYETPAVWSYDLGSTFGRIDLTGEFGASYWWADGGRYRQNVWQLNAIPMFRWWTGGNFYIEAGVGATLFNHTTFGDKNISTAFQFGDHIGAGFQIDKNSRIGLRISHFSNASIKKPNPGLDLVQLTYLYQF